MTSEATWTRRNFLATAAGAMVLAPEVVWAARLRGNLKFRLVETAGLRRFGYPVRAILPGVDQSETHFRLSKGGQVIPAQFRAVDGPDGGPAVMVDFHASPAPLAAEDYDIAFGADLEPGPEPKPGLRVERTDQVYRISSGSSLRYEVPVSLAGFLQSVANAQRPYLATEPAEGLWIRSKQKTIPIGGAGAEAIALEASVAREGPLAAALLFEPKDDGGLSPSVSLTFPSSKSWVEAAITVPDPEGVVASLGLDLHLAIEGAPTLVDLGANDTVYAQLRGNEQFILTAGETSGRAREGALWLVQKGRPDRLEPFAQAPKEGALPAEGWAHVMDKARCTALAMADFGRATRDRIETHANGRVRLVRDYAGPDDSPQPGTKRWTFWFHFVPMPVQVGAATSPQAMLAPLKVVWEEPRP